jgi:mercuric ion transport protein
MSNPAGASPPASRTSGSTAALLTLGGIGAAFGLAACCALPFLLAGLGLGTAWLAGIGLFALFHRTAFIAAALIGLGGAAILLLRQRRTMKPAAWVITGAVWLIGAILFYYGYNYV